MKADYYNSRQFLSVLLPYYHKLKASSEDFEDIFFQILTIRELFKGEDMKTLIYEFWEEENINNVFLENISSNASNRDIRTKLKHQLDIIFLLYAKDLSSLEWMLQGLIERCNELYFNHLCDHCEFERISTGLFANLKDFLLNLSKSPNSNEKQKNWILLLFQKFK